MNNNLTDLMNMNTEQERPWWFVRPMLLATLTLLLMLLVALISRPEILDRVTLTGL